MERTRLIACAPRECFVCEDEIPEGGLFTKMADKPMCLECEDYAREQPSDQWKDRKRF